MVKLESRQFCLDLPILQLRDYDYLFENISSSDPTGYYVLHDKNDLTNENNNCLFSIFGKVGWSSKSYSIPKDKKTLLRTLSDNSNGIEKNKQAKNICRLNCVGVNICSNSECKSKRTYPGKTDQKSKAKLGKCEVCNSILIHKKCDHSLRFFMIRVQDIFYGYMHGNGKPHSHEMVTYSNCKSNFFKDFNLKCFDHLTADHPIKLSSSYAKWVMTDVCVPMESVLENPFKKRRFFPKEQLSDLQSIKSNTGIIFGNSYQLAYRNDHMKTFLQLGIKNGFSTKVLNSVTCHYDCIVSFVYIEGMHYVPILYSFIDNINVEEYYRKHFSIIAQR